MDVVDIESSEGRSAVASRLGLGLGLNLGLGSGSGSSCGSAGGLVDERVDVIVASGSTLCGQVGRRREALATLHLLASALAPGGEGRAVVTGFTTSFLTPALLRAAGLAVDAAASVPSEWVAGLETGWGRFHMWVLRRVGVGRPLTEPPPELGVTSLTATGEKANARGGAGDARAGGSSAAFSKESAPDLECEPDLEWAPVLRAFEGTSRV